MENDQYFDKISDEFIHKNADDNDSKDENNDLQAIHQTSLREKTAFVSIRKILSETFQ